VVPPGDRPGQNGSEHEPCRVLILGPQGLPIRGLLEEQEAAPNHFDLALGLEPLLKFSTRLALLEVRDRLA
jgi:hypothetical protein